VFGYFFFLSRPFCRGFFVGGFCFFSPLRNGFSPPWESFAPQFDSRGQFSPSTLPSSCPSSRSSFFFVVNSHCSQSFSERSTAHFLSSFSQRLPFLRCPRIGGLFPRKDAVVSYEQSSASAFKPLMLRDCTTSFLFRRPGRFLFSLRASPFFF